MERVGLWLSVGVIFAFLTGCAADQAIRKENERLRAALQEEQRILAGLQKERAELEEKLRWSELEIAELKLKLEETQKLADLSEEFKKAIEGIRRQFGAGIEVIPGGVRLEEAVLFDPGSAEVKERGREILKRIAPELKREGLYFTIIGHTDSDPIKKSAHLWRTRTNRELSLYRALNVWLVLKAEGIDPSRVICAGMGEHHPIAPNDTAENKRRNRRVEIILLEKPAFDALMPKK